MYAFDILFACAWLYTTTVMSSDEFDNIPDEFDGIEGIDWTGILSGSVPPNVSTGVELPAARSPSASSYWSCVDDEMDSAFLAELDALEHNITFAEAGPSESRVAGMYAPYSVIVCIH